MSEPDVDPRLVVGVGASAGGLDAFKKLLSTLPDKSGLTFVLVQHLDPTHKSLLAELLAPCTRMEVRDADQDIRLRPDTVYIIRPDTALAVKRGRIQLTVPTLHRGVRLPVDHLFTSLAREYGPRAVGIVLSGAGSDGSRGLRDIKAAGGLAIAQEPESSVQAGMPQSAIDTGVVDLILQIHEMPAALERFASLPPAEPVEVQTEAEECEVASPNDARLTDQDLSRLAAIIKAQLNFDLSVYKSGTVQRRVIRRMVLAGLDGPDTYFEQLRNDVGEQQMLVRDLLISVTDFFRDTDAFQALREQVVSPAVASSSPGANLRVWVPGCATGEEAYSIAMEFLEEIDASQKRISLQLFATDIDAEALAFARSGMYPPTISADVPQAYLKKYFKPLEGKGFQVATALRDVVSFASHDLTKDPPFSRMDLVSCRNVLIYLTATAQQHVLRVLHFALQPNGVLFLGTSETIGPQRELFSVLSKPCRIFRKLGVSRPISVQRALTRAALDPGPPAQQAEAKGNLKATDLARRTVLEALVPPALVVSENGNVLFMHGELESFLRFPQGENPRLDLAAMLRPEIATRTRGALYKCRRNAERVEVLSSPDPRDDGYRVKISAVPAPAMGDEAVLLVFERVHVGAPERELEVESPAHEAMLEQLERELQATREDLRNTVEELETSNEELRSANEESMSMNEELQSANEELEATTEELRSLNEELTTVNAQLREKVDQLEQANDDLANFLSSSKVATIFLDDRLAIKRFTPAAADLLVIDHGDIGRPVGSIAHELLQSGLDRDGRRVLEHLSPKSVELHTSDGRWVSRQVLPYRTETRRIEGVVVTFLDITDLKVATEQLALRERQQAGVARNGINALRTDDIWAFLDQVVRDVQQTLATDYCKILELQPGKRRLLLRAGVGWKEGLVGNAFVSAGADSQAGYTLQSSEPIIVEDLKSERRFKGPDLLLEHDVTSGLSCVIREDDHEYGVIGVHTREPRGFSSEDANFVQAMAAVIGGAVRRSQTRFRLALEARMSRVLSETVTEEQMLSRALHVFVEELDADAAELWWVRADQRRLFRRDHYSAASSVGREREPSELGFGEGLVGRIASDGRAEWATDIGEPRIFEAYNEAGSAFRSAIGLPIAPASLSGTGEVVMGVLLVLSKGRLMADGVFLRSMEALGQAMAAFVNTTEASLRAKQLAAITASSHDAIIGHDFDGNVTAWLAGAESLYGFKAKDMLGESMERIVPDEARESFHEVLARVSRGESVEAYETTRVRADGKVIEVSVRSSPVRDVTNSIIGVSSADRDVTRMRETERRLVEADRQKDQFLAMLGHELRNPVAAIRSASDVLRERGGDDEQLDVVHKVLDRQSFHMARLLDSLLDVSRIVSGKIVLQREVVDFAEVCRDVVSDAQKRAGSSGVDISSDIPSDRVLVDGDRVRLAQIVDNILSNAVKFTDAEGAISLSLEQRGDLAVLRIRDNGSGIESEVLPNIFEVFSQSAQSLDRNKGGLGLGLALVSSLVKLHGGTVVARSDGPGRGSEFEVRMPRCATTRPTPRAAEAPSGGARRVLLVEDNPDTARMLQILLSRAGHDVHVAENGRAGYEAALEIKPDVILCDLGLPGEMSGYDVARACRSNAELQDTYLVAVSGYGRDQDKEQCRTAGFDEHLTKPVEVDTFLQLINRRTPRS